MLQYFLKRILYSLSVILGVIVIVFFLFQGLGDPTRMLMGQRSDLATQQNIKAELYLDQPLGKQLLFYLNDISPISIYSSAQIQSKNLKGFFWGTENKKIGVKVPYLRRSYQSKKDVMDILMDALPGTLMLASASMLLAILLGIPLGVLSAIKKDTWWDSTALFTSILGISARHFSWESSFPIYLA